MTESYIQARLFYEYEKFAFAFFDNIYFFSERDYETDFLLFEVKSRKMLCTEFEIKVTHSDFLKDFDKELKHENYKNGVNCPNHFYYIAPKGVIPVEEIPDHAGLYEVTESRIVRAKVAPKLTEDELDPTDAYRKAYNKYFVWRKSQYKKLLHKGIKRKRKRYRKKKR